MSFIDTGLGELFPTINLDSMGSARNILSDELSEIFKPNESHPFIAFSEADLDTGESAVQIQNFYDCLEDSCIGELLNECSSPVSLNSDNLCLNGELKKRSLDLEIRNSTAAESQNIQDISSSIDSLTTSKSQKRDLHPRDVIDTFDALDHGGICSAYVTFESILGEPKECLSSLTDDVLPPEPEIVTNYCPHSISSQDHSSSSSSKENGKCSTSNPDVDPISNALPEENCFPSSLVRDSTESISSTPCRDSTCNVERLPQQKTKRKEIKILPHPTEFFCIKCQPKAFFPSEESLKSHNDSHDKGRQRSFKCEECESMFTKRRDFLNHLRKHKIRRCPTCSKEFPENSYKNHLACHDIDAKFLCEICGLTFISKIKLFEHQSLHTSVKPYVCEFCNKSFTSHGSFWVHKKYHESPTPFKCDLCGQSFRRSSALAIHRRGNCLTSFNSTVNKNAAPVIFQVNSDSKNLKIVTSKLKKQHQCEFCQKKFPTTTSLKIHITTHTKERPFQCECCSKTFPTKNSLTKHSKNISACSRYKRRMLLPKIQTHHVSPVQILPNLGINA